MIRAPWGDQAYWNKWRAYSLEGLQKEWDLIGQPSKNPTYRPQYVWDTARGGQLRTLLRCYCCGDSIRELNQYFLGLLDAWELSNKLAAELNAQQSPGQGWDHRHLTGPVASDDPRAHTDPRAWIFQWSNLNHYNWCFWLVGLALALEIPDDQWRRLLALIDNEGQDQLLDRIIASRQPERPIGAALLHPKPYARLLKAINAPKGKQTALLRDFVDHWYVELAVASLTIT